MDSRTEVEVAPKSKYYGVSVLSKKKPKEGPAHLPIYYSSSPTDTFLNSTDYAGETDDEQDEKCYWGVSIWIDGKTQWLGSFKQNEEELAAKVYDAHMYYYRGKEFNPNVYKLNGLLTNEEIEEIHQTGIPECYRRRNKNKNQLPRGISRRGTKFRVCVQRNGRKLEKIVDRLDIAINLLSNFDQ